MKHRLFIYLYSLSGVIIIVTLTLTPTEQPKLQKETHERKKQKEGLSGEQKKLLYPDFSKNGKRDYTVEVSHTFHHRNEV